MASRLNVAGAFKKWWEMRPHLMDNPDGIDMTLDYYMWHMVQPRDDLNFHCLCLSTCIALFDHGTRYIVKQTVERKTKYNIYDKAGLRTLLEAKSVDITLPGKRTPERKTYYKLFCLPQVCDCLQTFIGIDFYGQREDYFDVWAGFPFSVLPVEEAISMQLIQPWLDHVKDVICGGNERLYKLEIAKDAWIFQHPNEHVQWATVLMGPQGAGKNTYTDVSCSLWGAQYSEPCVNDVNHILEKGNQTLLAFKKVVVANELPPTIRGSRAFNKLKAFICDSEYTLKDLFKCHVTIRNINNFIFISNNYDSIQIGLDDRRYFLLEVSADKVGHVADYFVPLKATITEEMLTHLLNYFLRFDVSQVAEFSVLTPPVTELRRELVELWKTASQRFIESYRIDRNGEPLEVIYDAFVRWCFTDGQRNPLASKQNPMGTFGIEIKDFVVMRVSEDGMDRLYFRKEPQSE
jgi:hypothetical protein